MAVRYKQTELSSRNGSERIHIPFTDHPARDCFRDGILFSADRTDCTLGDSWTGPGWYAHSG